MRAWSRAAPAAAFAASLATGLVEWLVTSASAGILRPGVLWALLGLHLPVGLLGGLGLALLLRGLDASSPGLSARARSAWRGEDGELSLRSGSWVLAGAAAATLPGLVVLAVHLSVSQHFAVQRFAAVLLALIAVAATGLAALVAAALRSVAAAILSRVPVNPLRTAVGIVAAIPLLATAVVVAWVDVGLSILLLPATAVLWIAATSLITLGAARRERLRRVGLILPVLLAAAGAAHVVGARYLPEDAASRADLAAYAPLGGVLLGAAARLYDRDGDGHSALWLGADCAEGDPDVYPGATEILCNGIDDNCLGGDACPAAAAGGGAANSGGIAAAIPATLPAAIPDRPCFLIIAIDAVRPDRLGYMGYARATSPRLDSFAADAVAFVNAYTQAPNTPRAFPSFVTGRLPGGIEWGKGAKNFPPVAPVNATLFEALAAAGYYNVGLFQHYYFAAERGLGGGFARWDNAGALDLKASNTDSPAPEITARVIATLEELAGRDEPWALWTHYFEPHGKYVHHPKPFPRWGNSWPDRYDGEIAFTDHHVGEVLDTLDRLGLAQRTVVVIFSDHGEAFKEHRFSFHGQTLYEEVLRVPLLVRVPGLDPARVVAPVRLVDVAPTLLDLARAEPLPAPHGRSLVPLLVGGKEPSDRVVYAEMLPSPSWDHEQRAVIVDGWKLLYRVDENAWELYDLKADPGETTNLAETSPERLEALRAVIIEWMETGAVR